MEQKRQALGKGLNAILPGAYGDMLENISVELIAPNPYQPRKVFDEIAIGELALSIRENGVLQPILVRKRPDGKYELIAGERRLRASKQAGLLFVPCRVLDISDRSSLEIAILENVQRSDLNAIEEAEGYRRLMHEFDYTQEELAKRVGKSRTHITNVVRLLALPDGVKQKIHDDKISIGHAKMLLGIENADEIADRIINDKWSVREIESYARRKREPRSPHIADPEEMTCAEQLKDLTGFNARVDMKKGTVSFYIKDTAGLDEFMEKLHAAFSSSSPAEFLSEKEIEE